MDTPVKDRLKKKSKIKRGRVLLIIFGCIILLFIVFCFFGQSTQPDIPLPVEKLKMEPIMMMTH